MSDNLKKQVERYPCNIYKTNKVSELLLLRNRWTSRKNLENFYYNKLTESKNIILLKIN